MPSPYNMLSKETVIAPSSNKRLKFQKETKAGNVSCTRKASQIIAQSTISN